MLAIAVVTMLLMVFPGAANASNLCPVTLPDPELAMTRTYVQVSFELTSKPPEIYDWGPAPDCTGGVCSVYVKVSHPVYPDCDVLGVMHTDRHIYSVPAGTSELDIFADNLQSWKFELKDLPPINSIVLHLHNVPLKSPAGFIMNETAPSPKDPAQQVSASCTFFGPAATSTYRFQKGTYAYVIFATGPEITYNAANVTLRVFRNASSSFEDIPGITPKTITGGCAGGNCIIKNEGSWFVSSEVRLDTGDRLAAVVTLTDHILSVLVDGTGEDDSGKVFTDSWISYVKESLADVSDFTSSPTGDVLMVIGDLALNPHGSKPPGVVYQQGRDTTPLGYLRGMVDNAQPSMFDTNSSVDANGRPGGAWPLIFTIGGPDINSVSHYYEHTDVTADRAPVTWSEEGSNVIWRVGNGTVVANVTQASTNVPPGTSDVFAIQIVRDADNRLVVLMYGERYTGTWAAAEYFKFIVYPTITSWTDSYYIVRWTDAASGTSANMMPDSGDTFEIIAQGV
jgi:hypothetical protein